MQTEAGERPIRVAIPNKGRLSERALRLFEQAGLKPEFRGERALVASLGDQFQAIFVRAADIPEYIADGAAELGVTGADLLAESGRKVIELLDLGFGRCRLAVAAKDDSDIERAVTFPQEPVSLRPFQISLESISNPWRSRSKSLRCAGRSRSRPTWEWPT